MVVIVLEKVPQGLRGELSRWMLEPKAGVFVGDMSALVREKLWGKIKKKADYNSGGWIFHSSNTEQGFVMDSFGDTKRTIIDFEGLRLVKILES